jgi:polyisoprenyl-phosphate glycosyltransferase
MNSFKVSVCIPVFNGSKTISDLVHAIKTELHNYQIEIVLVNDGSKDNSRNVCIDLALKYDHIKFINLRKNFGEHNAVLCGLRYTTGDYIIVMDDDFQNPPSQIIKLVEKAQEGDYDIVYSRYFEKKHHWFRNLGSSINDKFATWLINKPKSLYLSSFKLIKKEVVAEIVKYTGPFVYIDGLILRVTDNIGVKTVEHCERIDSESNYTLKKLISLWLNMFVNFSIKPLRVATTIGVLISLFGFLLGIYFAIDKIINPEVYIGWTSVMVALLFLSGINLIFLGIIGEYLGKQYLDQNGTPSSVVKDEYL